MMYGDLQTGGWSTWKTCIFGRYAAWCSGVISLSSWRNLSWMWTSHNCENQSSMVDVSWTASSSYIHRNLFSKAWKIYDRCVKGTLLHASKCWPLRREEVQRSFRKVWTMLRWMLKIKAKDNVSLSIMYGRLNVAPFVESKVELESSKMVGAYGKKWQMEKQMLSLRKRSFQGQKKIL